MLTRLLATTALALALVAPAWAQERQPDQMEGRSAPDTTERFPDQAPPAGETADSDELPTDQLALAQADTIKGSAVRNSQGEEIGDVQDVVLDVKKGQVAFAVLGVGGFLGVGEKNVAVPWNRLQPAGEPQTFVLDVDRQTLEKAPAFDSENIAAMQDPKARQDITRFWQEVPQQAQMPGKKP
ncbi:MAG TPA: PRC-barrel domain-containing protein [Bryobacteraceae bacterium]|nr:PRC-barrel domain-containing protein [Bryobacteraceae bacterium]